MRSIRALFAVSFLSMLTLLACSPADSGAPRTPIEGLEAPEADRGVQLGLKVKVEPGKEVVVCRELVLPGAAAIAVGKLEHASSPGTHHVHAYRSSTPPDQVSPDVFACGDLAGPLFYTAQKEAESTRFHPGVGVDFAKDEVVRLELHYLNTGSTTSEAELRLNLWFATAPITAEAGSFYMGDYDIAVPAHGEATTKMHCDIPEDISITSILPHVHVHGTGERIYLSGKGIDVPKLLVSSKGFGDLETRAFDDVPIQIKAGQTLDFECDFHNDDEQGLVEGSSTTSAEMCMLLGSYYPRLSSQVEWCTLSGSGPLHEGTTTCHEAMSCASAKMHDDAFEQESCAVDVCKGSSTAFNDVNSCGKSRCQATCPGEHCSECLADKCPSELSACQAAACGP